MRRVLCALLAILASAAPAGADRAIPYAEMHAMFSRVAALQGGVYFKADARLIFSGSRRTDPRPRASDPEPERRDPRTGRCRRHRPVPDPGRPARREPAGDDQRGRGQAPARPLPARRSAAGPALPLRADGRDAGGGRRDDRHAGSDGAPARPGLRGPEDHLRHGGDRDPRDRRGPVCASRPTPSTASGSPTAENGDARIRTSNCRRCRSRSRSTSTELVGPSRDPSRRLAFNW